MGGKSSSSQATTNKQSTNNIVNDGDYAGVGGDVVHDESSFSFTDESDHSFELKNDTDNSVEIENDIDNSVEIENDGTFAGSSGNINVLDGGAIEKSFNFATETVKESFKVADKAIDTVGNASKDFSKSLVESQKNTLKSFENVNAKAFDSVNKVTDKTLEKLEDISGDYSTSLTDFSKSFVEELSDVQVANSSDNKEQLQAIANLAKSTSLEGQDILAENSTKLALYFGGAVILVVMGAMYMSRGNNASN